MIYAKDVKFETIDITGATVHVAIIEGDLQYAVLSYGGRAYTNPRAVITSHEGILQDLRFNTLREAVAFVAEYLTEEYANA